ncbi:MAG: glycosyltransferase [Alphaproteobacteria bacterium]|nr:glycosyltransferase [Alphaproteobacteria bacterium]
MPRVSVLTPIYNTNPSHLREMIESILNQTFTDFEFLILNDSPENKEIEKIVKSYKDKRIKYFKNDKNMGITPSRNKLMDMACGEYIAVFDHDDISVPSRLEQQVNFLDKNPHIGVVSGWLKFFGNKTTILKNPEYDNDIKIFMTDDCVIAHTAAMIRKSVLDENNIRYDEYYSPSEDYKLWAQLMPLTHFYNIPNVLVLYRYIDGNTTNTQQDKMVSTSNAIRLELRNKYSAYYAEYRSRTIEHSGTTFRFRLFGLVPIFKIKNSWVFLFEFIPIFKFSNK